MQLKIRRSQRGGGLGAAMLTLHVMVDLTEEERALFDRHKWWSMVVYSSSQADRNAERMHAQDWKAFFAVLVDKFTKRFFTMRNLVSGEQIECRDLSEMLAAEQQIREACTNLKTYVELAKRFDGSEEIIDIAVAA